MLLKDRYSLFAPALLYGCLSIVLWLWIMFPEGHYDVDSYGYDAIATFFMHNGYITDPNNLTSAPIQPVGYPYIVGLIYRLCGCSINWVVLLQILLMCFVIVMLIALAYHLSGAQVACICGLLASCNVGFLIYPQLLLAETVLLAVIIVFVYQYFRFVKTKDLFYVHCAAASLGFSFLIKPIALFFVVPFGCLIFYALKGPWNYRLQVLLVVSLYFVAPIALYMYRNYVYYGNFSYAPMIGLNIYQVLLAKVISTVHATDEQTVIDTQLRFDASNTLDAEGWSHAKDQLYHYSKFYPLLFIQIWIMNVMKTWFGLYVTQLKGMIEPKPIGVTHSFFNKQAMSLYHCVSSYLYAGTTSSLVKMIALYELIYSIIRFIGCDIGLYVLWRKNERYLYYFFILFMLSFSMVTGIDGCCRYRLIFEPILLLLASIGLVYVYRYYKQLKGVCIYGVIK